jgi:3-oxoacyl-[acyl-carrier protein] reductase
MLLEGKIAIVTGAARGTGAAICRRFIDEGAKVVVTDVLSEEGRTQAVELGPQASFASLDVTNETQWASVVNDVLATHGRIDILVNNAGILRDKTLRKMAADDWQAVIDTNLTGVFNGCRAACDRISDGGRIVNISSISAAVGFYGQANYAAAKAGVVGLTKVVSRELAKRAITVNAVAPGVVLTDMGRTIPAESLDAMLEEIPLRRFGEPREIAEAILFLVSPMASYVTGQTLHVNGGWWG